MPIVFITGAARRLGRLLAVEFARRGWDVVVHYRSHADEAQAVVEEIARQGRRAVAVRAELSQPLQVRAAFEEALRLGVPDVLVNNAGVFPPRTPLESLTAELWQRTLESNLSASLYTSQAFAQVQQGSGRIINIASVGALESWRGRLPYNVSKAALLQLTRNLALELAPRIAVNAVCPGILQLEPGEVLPVPVERIPARRYGGAQDVFDAVYFFATATPYITGQCLLVDGGYHLR